MHIFIDANIFLDFFHLTSTDIEELRKLIALIEEGSINLYFPEQTFDEIARNRDAKISDALEKFRKDTGAFKVNFPAFTKSFPEYKAIQELLREANKKHSEAYQKSLKLAEEKSFDADTLIGDLIKVATVCEFSQPIYENAIQRFRKGNPPGKGKTTVGDEINWESLKSKVPNDVDLHIISKDRDYKSSLGKGDIDAYLAAEWKADKNGNVALHESLTDFFSKNFPEIKIAADVKNNALIERLASSASFATTHAIVGSLLDQAAFTTSQAEQIISIAQLNSQVGWIIEDDDVRSLYLRVRDENGNDISKESKKTLDELLTPAAEETPETYPVSFSDEVPF